MKIIHRGELPEERVWTGTCSTCHSIIEAKETEVEIYDCQREGRSGSAKCPVCNFTMYFYQVRQ